MLLSVISINILLRIFGIHDRITTLMAAGFGVTGLAVILMLSRRKGKMFHCLLWCPISLHAIFLALGRI